LWPASYGSSAPRVSSPMRTLASIAAPIESPAATIARYAASARVVSPAATQARPASDRNCARKNGNRAASAARSYASAASLGCATFSYAAPNSPYACAPVPTGPGASRGSRLLGPRDVPQRSPMSPCHPVSYVLACRLCVTPLCYAVFRLYAPGVTRTPGQRFRKPLLYPPELQGLSPAM